MNLLTGAFSALLSLSVTALPVMAVVVLARILLARVPGKYRYVLWAAVGFRLICPVALASPVSLFNLSPMEPVAQRTVQSAGAGLTAVEYNVPAAAERLGNLAAAPATGATSAQGLSALEIGALFWLAGLLVIAVYAAVSDVRLRQRLRTAVLLEGNVYEAEGIPTAFVLGLVRPRIYLPFSIPEEEQAYILLHEQTHLRRLDPWWKLLAFLLLAVYWWNPAVWVCFALFCRDMERSCDEAVLHRLGPEIKQAYGRVLVSFAAGRRLPAAAPLAFGEGDAKRRVLGVLRWKQAGPRVAFAAAVVCVFLVLSLCTNAFVAGNYIKCEGSGSTVGIRTNTFSYNFTDDVKNVTMLLEIYDGGKLVGSTAMPLGNASESQSGIKLESGDVMSRRGTIQYALTMDPGWKSLSYHMTLGKDAASSSSITLPGYQYTGSTEQTLGENSRKKLFSLNPDSSTVLSAMYISYDGNATFIRPVVDCQTLTENVSQGFQNQITLVVMRLVTSSSNPNGADQTRTYTDRALTLCGFRNPYVGNMPADGELLSTLMEEALGNYTVELFTSQQPYVLQVDLKEAPNDPNTADQTMEKHAFVLLALIDNLDEVRWTWPEDDGSTHTGSFAQQDADAALSLSSSTILQGRTGIKDFSGSPQDVQDLLNFLNWREG